MRSRSTLAWALAGWAGAGLGSAVGDTVRVQVRDDSGAHAVPARASLWRGDEPLLPPGFSSYSQGDEQHFLVPGDFVLDLEPGRYRLRVERGLESVPVEIDLEVPGETVVPVRLRRWIDMNAEGWYSADMHVHRDPADIPLVLRAEDLNFVPTIATHVWSSDVSQPWKPPSDFPVVVEPDRLFTGNAQEVERIQGGPGAVILLARDLPLPFTGYELYPPTVEYTRKVHERGGLVEGDKLFWVDTFVNAALGEIDFIELNCNHFLPRLVDMDLAPWSHWPMEFGYRGPRGFALWMMDLYYRILNSGIELPLSAGSANGVKATPVGYDRVYVRLGEGRFDYPGFMRALKQGRSFSTNGPILELDVDGRYGPGDRIDVASGDLHRFRARARSRGALETLQLIVNGAVVAEVSGQGARELTLEKTLGIDTSSWAAVRAFEAPPPAEFWQPAPLAFGHTSPVYFRIGDQPVVVPESVQDLLQKIDRLIAHTGSLEGFREESHRQETLDVYREAREVLSRRLPAATDLVEEVKSHQGGIALWWMGNAGWLIKSDRLLIGIDLDLETGQRIGTPPLTATDLAGLLDVVFATHHHGDHCNVPTIRTLAREGQTTFVLPRPCLKRVSATGIPLERLIVPEPGEPFEVAGIRVEPLHAIHGNQEFTVLTREPDFVESIAHNCGYVLNMQGRRFFHPGDSVLTEEHLFLQNIDVLFVSPTVHNMSVDRSMILINHLEPSYIFPQHFETYLQTDENAFWTRGYPDELKQRLSRTLQERYHKLRQGEMFVIP